MSEFNGYAKKLDAAFQVAAEKQRAAYNHYKTAEKAKKDGPQIKEEKYPGQIKAAEAQLDAEYQQAIKELKDVQKNVWPEFYDTRRKLRGDLEQEITRAQLVDPEAVDRNTLELLKNDTLTAADIENIYNHYSDNPTMRRIIGAEAKRRADGEENTEARRTLTAIDYDSRKATDEVLKNWDSLSGVSSHYSGETSQNKDAGYICAMCDHWNDDNVRDAIKNF